MSHLIDTNVLSELWKLQSEPAVIAFLDSVEWFVPVSVSAEIQEGAEAAPSDKKKIDINARLDVFLRDHSKTMMDFDTEDARVWGRLKHSQEVKRSRKPCGTASLMRWPCVASSSSSPETRKTFATPQR